MDKVKNTPIDIRRSKMKVRNSNIELLRIIAALGVIILHYNNSSLGGAFGYVEKRSINDCILYFLESLNICAVNIFCIISGFFMAESKKKDILRVVNLLIQMVVFVGILNFAEILIDGRPFEIGAFLYSLIPTGIVWFIIIYCALFCLSPFLNLLFQKVVEKNKQKEFLTAIIVLFSIYPTILSFIGSLFGEELNGLSTIASDGDLAGYSIVNFIMLYYCGCYLQYKEKSNDKKEEKPILYLVAIIMIAALITMIAWVDHLYAFEHVVWEYCNILVVIETVVIFEFFLHLKIKQNKIINSLAKASLASYLFHYHFLKYMRINEYVKKSVIIMILHVFGCACLLYLGAYILNLLYEFLTKGIFGYISRKWVKNRYIDVE